MEIALPGLCNGKAEYSAITETLTVRAGLLLPSQKHCHGGRAVEMAGPIVLWYHGVALGQGNEVTWLSGEDGYDRDRHHYEGKYPGNWQSVSDEEVFEPESAKLRTSSARRGC